MIYDSSSPHLFLISAVMVMKACSTLVAFFALVSRKGMPISSAKACAMRISGPLVFSSLEQRMCGTAAAIITDEVLKNLWSTLEGFKLLMNICM